MAQTKMSNFGGTITATNLANNNGSELIKVAGISTDNWTLRSERGVGTTVIVFSMVLTNRSNANATVNVALANSTSSESRPDEIDPVYVAKDVVVVPGRPVSLDYKINMTPENALYVCADVANVVDIVVSAVQL